MIDKPLEHEMRPQKEVDRILIESGLLEGFKLLTRAEKGREAVKEALYHIDTTRYEE